MRAWPALVLPLLFACSDPILETFDASPADSGAPRDTGVDTGVRDTGANIDTGTILDADAMDVDPIDADPVDADPIDADPVDGAPADADLDAGIDDAGEAPDTGPACVADSPCATNPGAPCRQGVTLCSSSGELCVDGPPAADGIVCATGLCSGGLCLGPTVINADVNLSTDSLTPGRTCAEGVTFSVAAIVADTVTLTSTLTAGCLAPGDEVLVINLQGTAAAQANVGAYSLLEISAVAGELVTVVDPPASSFGDAPGANTGIGTGPADQKVALIRVPAFGALVVDADTVVTANAWNGAHGGVVALRAASLELDGSLDATRLGYRGGRWSLDDQDCDDSLLTESGESIAGPGISSTTRSFGGAGGINAALDISFNGNTPLNASAGHALPGEIGDDRNTRLAGEPGEAYGTGDGAMLTMGSGPGGGLTCNFNVPALTLIPAGYSAAGIVVLLVGDAIIGPSGSISATAQNAGRDVAGSGGYVLIRGNNLDLGDTRVTALGALGANMNLSGPNFSNEASPGYIAIESTGTVTGTTAPVAFLQIR